jgi:hypothetical protein
MFKGYLTINMVPVSFTNIEKTRRGLLSFSDFIHDFLAVFCPSIAESSMTILP